MRRVNTSRKSVIGHKLTAITHGNTETEISYADGCENPAGLHLFGYPDKLLVNLKIEQDRNTAQEILVPCRKCPGCLRQRQRLWTARAIAETRMYSRTWFGTLTFNPLERSFCHINAQRRSHAHRLEALDPDTKFRALATETGRLVTLWLKRVRKNTGSKLRYLVVCEKHADGFPHHHILLHEMTDRITKVELEKNWTSGFSHWRLVERSDAKKVGYVTKYLAKEAQTRVRASQRYGQPNIGIVSDALTELNASLLAIEETRVMQGAPACLQKNKSE